MIENTFFLHPFVTLIALSMDRLKLSIDRSINVTKVFHILLSSQSSEFSLVAKFFRLSVANAQVGNTG